MPPESPVWDLPGVIITPHVSGWSKDESVSFVIQPWYFKICFDANISQNNTFC